MTRDVISRFKGQVKVTNFNNLSTKSLKSYAPTVIVSKIVTPGFDVLDLAKRLTDMNFTGAYITLPEPMVPKPEVILNEVRTMYPRLHVDIMQSKPVLH